MKITTIFGRWSGVWIVFLALFIGILLSNISTILPALTLNDIGERKLLDTKFRWRQRYNPPKPQSAPIVIVEADDESELALRLRWPYSRSIWAHLVNNLHAAGAKLIVFDIQFGTPADSAGDAAFADAIKHAGNVLLAGELMVERNRNLAEEMYVESPPDPNFVKTGAPWANVNVPEDIDKVVHHYLLGIDANGKLYLSLGLKALEMYRGDSIRADQIRYSPELAQFGNLSVPTYGQLRMWINYAGPAGKQHAFPYYKLAQVLDDASFDLAEGYDTDWMELTLSPPPPGSDSLLMALAKDNPFKDKIVFVGNTMPAMQDVRSTPFDLYDPSPAKMPGVEIHAHALWTLLSNSFLIRISFWIQFFIWLLLCIPVWWVAHHRSVWVGVIITVASILLVFFGSAFVFIYGNYMTQSIAPMSSISLVFILTVLRRVLREQKEKAKIRGMFGRYVPKKVVGELLDKPEMLRLGGERRRLTVLFTDVAGFTSISERMSPEALVSLLNEYLTAMTREILAEEGIIDKYEGDLIMAEFGAPIHYPDHAIRACRSALRMQRKLAELRTKWANESRPKLYSRVGINTGDMIVGNMGSEDVFDYTVMGDAVNLGSRLESVNKIYETTIICSADTLSELGDAFVTRFLDRIRVIGKTQVVEIYEVVAENNGSLPPKLATLLATFREARQKYDEGEFETSCTLFKRVLALDPNDGPAKTFYERSLGYLRDPPPDNWDKVYTLTEK